MSLLKTNEIQNYNGSSLTLTASTVSTSAQLNTGGNISVTGSLNVSDDSTTRTNLGLGTIATQDSDSIIVTGGTATLGALTVSGSDSGDLVRITQTGSGNALVVEDSANPDSTPFVVDASGNVGVGNSSPSSPNANDRFIHIGSSTTAHSALVLEDDTSAFEIVSNGGLLTFRDGVNTRVTIDSSGNVGVGNSSPSSPNANDRFIHIGSSTTAHSSLVLEDDTSAFEIVSNGGLLTFRDGVNTRATIDLSGNLLVGYTSSNGSYKLQVNSQIYATSSTIATSDFNYKENITPLDGALSLVSQLNPVQFDWKEHPVHEFDRNQPTVGFIAQEVQKVFSDQPYVNSIVKSNECIIEPEEIDEEGNVIKEAVIEEFLGIAEGNMIALLTKAIKEQQVIIDALTARIEALETP